MVVVPAASDVTRPVELTVAVTVDDELHVATLVRSALLPSLYLPVAVNCWLVFTGMEDAAGDRVMDCKVAPLPVALTFRVAVA